MHTSSALNYFAGVPFNAASQALGIVVTDESLGALMRHMEELGELENTVIIVKADHGLIEKSAVRPSAGAFQNTDAVNIAWQNNNVVFPSMGDLGSETLDSCASINARYIPTLFPYVWRLVMLQIYQGGALAPFFAMGPAPFDKPQTISQAVSTVDITPTMMDIAGSADYPYLTDGQSFLPLLRGDKVRAQKMHLSAFNAAYS